MDGEGDFKTPYPDHGSNFPLLMKKKIHTQLHILCFVKLRENTILQDRLCYKSQLYQKIYWTMEQSTSDVATDDWFI